jgi:hypothetical protein
MDEHKKISLDIVLRTHDFIDVHSHPKPRYCGANKQTVILKSIQSLVNSANEFDGCIKFIWLDDHSRQDTIDKIHTIFSKSKYEYEYIPLEVRGWNASGYEQFERGRSSDADLVYFVEDDYLHYPSAITEMVESYYTFKFNLGKEVAIHPFDDPDNYKPEYIMPTRVVLGKDRRWRTNEYTTFTFLCNPEIVKKHWSKFYTLATEYMTEWGENNNIHEGTTINSIWRDDVILFTPIPSVALHLQFEEQRDRYLDWETLWKSIEI